MLCFVLINSVISNPLYVSNMLKSPMGDYTKKLAFLNNADVCFLQLCCLFCFVSFLLLCVCFVCVR